MTFRKLAIAALAAATTGCASMTYEPELRIGCGPRHVHQPGKNQLEGACELVLTQRVGERAYCNYRHASEPQDGRGGDQAEADVGIDEGMCGAIFGGKRR